eukprot:2397496-Rhodomonas_salina.1
MMALPFAKENLIEPEIAEIKKLVAEKLQVAALFPNGVVDPCPKYCKTLEYFVSWYFKARKTRKTKSSILEIADL